jgi:hypothetical protein
MCIIMGSCVKGTEQVLLCCLLLGFCFFCVNDCIYFFLNYTVLYFEIMRNCRMVINSE